MTQKERILDLLRNSPDREVSCQELQNNYLFHKASSRISSLNASGFEIRYIKGESVMTGKYRLVYDKDFDSKELRLAPVKIDRSEDQYRFEIGA